MWACGLPLRLGPAGHTLLQPRQATALSLLIPGSSRDSILASVSEHCSWLCLADESLGTIQDVPLISAP